MGNKTLLQLSACVAALSLMACGGQQQSSSNTNQQQAATPVANSKPAKGATIGFAHCCVHGEISTMDTAENTIKKIATERGANLLFETAEDSKHRDDLSVQPNQVKSMIDKGAKVIILISVNGKGADVMQKEIVEYAKSKGVQIIAARRPLPKSVHTRFDNAISVASSTEAPGLLQGKMVVDAWKKHTEWDKNADGTIQYGILQGAKDYPKTLARTNSFVKAVSADDQKLERIAAEYTNWERPKAKEVVAKWIKSGKINKMEMIVSNSDDLALGALDAFKEANKPPIPLFGINAIDEAQTAIKNGEMAGSVLQDVEAQARVSYQMAENIALGKSPMDGIDLPLEGGHTVNVPYAVVTQETLGQ